MESHGVVVILLSVMCSLVICSAIEDLQIVMVTKL